LHVYPVSSHLKKKMICLSRVQNPRIKH
jgi:hypothetical protein